jgi:bifunctional non-homologous end joining protein LigD
MLNTIELMESLTIMLATAERPDVLPTLVGTHVFDEKLDGIRALAAWDENGAFSMRNRSGKDITSRYPEIALAATNGDFTGPLLLDGEIISIGKAFQDIAWRDKQNGRGADKVPATFTAFDVLVTGEQGDLRHQPYAFRRQVLNNLRLEGQFARSLCSPDPAFFDRIKSMGGEGVVAKRLRAPYARGRSTDWLKVKALYSVTALATGYEPGSGARSEMGAIFLSLLSPTPKGYMLHPIGKAGSGFSPATALDMKAALDSAVDVASVPVVEIECLGATRSGVLRQPVFKGLRTDLTYEAATFDQLDPLPRS